MMRIACLIIGMFVGGILTPFAQESKSIAGKWENPSGGGRIEIYAKGDRYYGKIVWLKEPNDPDGRPKKDGNNPEANLQNRALLGLEILTGFEKTGKTTWENGKIYDPKSGKTYNCKMTLNGVDKLDIRGFIGVSLLGRTETWKRMN